MIRYYKSMIARHVDAIVSDGYDPAFKPIFRKVRKAGILLVSSGDDIAGKRDLWVSQSDPAAYGRALADALASQIHDKGDKRRRVREQVLAAATDGRAQNWK